MRRKRRLRDIGRRSTPATVPGHIAPRAQAGSPRINVLAYDSSRFAEIEDVEPGALGRLRREYDVVWIDVVEFGDASRIAEIGKVFGLHALALEDAVNTHQRPKVEDYEDHLFLTARMLRNSQSFETEQVAFFLGEGFLITFQERAGDCFDPVRKRIRKGKGRIRSARADYLCYALIDAIVDMYFPALERVGEKLEDIEDEIVGNPDSHEVRDLHELKRDLLMLRRAIWPHREMINNLNRDDHPLVTVETRLFLRDTYDHTIQLMDIVETYREIASGLMDVYISSVSAQMNEVMKVLTIIATIFMPLGFIASVYGMNFDRTVSPWNMPELGWSYGYPFALVLMVMSAGGLFWWFWRKGWIIKRSR